MRDTAENDDTPKHPRMGWCERRNGDRHAPNEHDGSFLHTRTPECLNFTYPPVGGESVG